MANNQMNLLCPIANSLEIIGDAWSWLILRDAHDGLTRFDEFRKNLNIAPTMLTKRLNTLVEAGLLKKNRYSEHPPRDEYILTDAGKDFLPVLFALGAWGRKHRPDLQKADTITFIDVENGTAVVPLVIDEVTGAPIGTRQFAKA